MNNNCFFQMNTNNKSFLRMVDYLKEEGYGYPEAYLPLTLYDKTLENVNVYDIDSYQLKPYEKMDLQFKIMKECEKNVWYFFREVLRVPWAYLYNYYQLYATPVNERLYTRFLLDKSFMAVLYLYSNKISSYEIKPIGLDGDINNTLLLFYDFMFNFERSDENSNYMLVYNEDKYNMILANFASMFGTLVPHYIEHLFYAKTIRMNSRKLISTNEIEDSDLSNLEGVFINGFDKLESDEINKWFSSNARNFHATGQLFPEDIQKTIDYMYLEEYPMFDVRFYSYDKNELDEFLSHYRKPIPMIRYKYNDIVDFEYDYYSAARDILKLELGVDVLSSDIIKRHIDIL